MGQFLAISGLLIIQFITYLFTLLSKTVILSIVCFKWFPKVPQMQIITVALKDKLELNRLSLKFGIVFLCKKCAILSFLNIFSQQCFKVIHFSLMDTGAEIFRMSKPTKCNEAEKWSVAKTNFFLPCSFFYLTQTHSATCFFLPLVNMKLCLYLFSFCLIYCQRQKEARNYIQKETPATQSPMFETWMEYIIMLSQQTLVVKQNKSPLYKSICVLLFQLYHIIQFVIKY